jgi:hypothetical protein
MDCRKKSRGSCCRGSNVAMFRLVDVNTPDEMSST